MPLLSEKNKPDKPITFELRDMVPSIIWAMVSMAKLDAKWGEGVLNHVLLSNNFLPSQSSFTHFALYFKMHGQELSFTII